MRRSGRRARKFSPGRESGPFAVRRMIGFLLVILLFFGGIESGWGMETVKADGADTILFVKMDGNDGNSGTSWNDAFATLQKALDEADTSGGRTYQIWIAKGTYTPTPVSGSTAAAHFEMKNGVAIYGGFAGTEDPASFSLADRDFAANKTTLSGDMGSENYPAYHVFYNYNLGLNATAILDGVTITKGNAVGTSEDGGGMYNYNSSPTLTNVTISGNYANNNGGGIYNQNNSNPRLTDVTISGNNATRGGGMSNASSSPILDHVTISDNTGLGMEGGGMANWDNSSPTLTNVTISGNVASLGGGMYNSNSSPTLVNVAIIGNQARAAGGGDGGGMYSTGSSSTLTNVTISGNQAGDMGGGIFNDNSSNTTIRNSIIWGNSSISSNSHNITAPIFPIGSTYIFFSYSLIEGSNGSGGSWNTNYGADEGHNIDGDPGFKDYQPASDQPTTSGDYHLLKDSPAINAGNNEDIPTGVTTDVDGKARVAGASVDLGAYEFQPPAAPANLGGTAGDEQVALTWSAAADADSYTVYRYEGTTAPADPADWTEVAATVTSATYTVTGLTNGTGYAFAVKAVNIGGDSDFSNATVVTPRTVPDAPTGVSAIAGNGEAEVSFTAPGNTGGSAITGYTVTAWVGGNATAITATGAASPITVTGLTNGAAYTFTVRAANALGDSPESAQSGEVTPRTVPDVPTGVSATAGNGEAEVSFTAPGNNGGSAITGYTVTALVYGGATTITATGVASPITVTGLTNGTAYTFTVRAANAAGDSPESTPSGEATPLPSDPAVPANLGGTAGDQQVTLSWDAATGADSYMVYKYEGAAAPAAPVDWTEVAASETGTTYTVTGLTNGTSYAFAVKAVNLGGQSGFSNAVVVTPRAVPVTTPQTVPDAPTGVSVDAGNGEAEVNFIAPANNGGSAITGYMVTAWVDGNATAITATGAASPITVTGLTNGTAYTFTVRAANAAGDSPESAPSDEVTPRTVPVTPPQTVADAPTGVSATAGNGEAEVSFTAPANNGGSAITGYTVTAWVGGNATAITATGTASPITVTGLTNGTAYTFTVRAANALGDSPESAPSDLATPQPPAPNPEPAAPKGSGNDSFVGPVISTNGSITIPVGRSGEVNQDGVISIMIPAGAADQEQRITIAKVLNTQDLLSDGETPISDIYELLKNFPGTFNKPVTLTFILDPSVAGSNQAVAVFYYDETEKKWIKIGGEISGNSISVEVNHFTKFAVFAIDEAATTPDQDEIVFSDISGHWAEDSIKQAVLDGIIAGYPDGTFRPDEPVSRAEFTVMLANALKLDGTGAILPFTDRGEIGAWAEEAVARAVQAGIVNGYEDGRFRPNAPITRAEMAAMIAKALQLPTGATSQTGFSDDDRIPGWAKSAVEELRRLGIVSGRGDNKYVPNDTATRAETVVTLLSMLKSLGQN